MQFGSRRLTFKEWWSHGLRSRRLAQGFVELSLTIAIVVVVGAAGLNVLGGAEGRILSGKDAPPHLGAPPPRQEYFKHYTQLTPLSCSPTLVLIGLTPPFTCGNLTVTDLDSTDPVPPWGRIELYLDGSSTLVTYCDLPRSSSGSTNSCQFRTPYSNLSYGSNTVAATYNPIDPLTGVSVSNHFASNSPNSQTVTIEPGVKFESILCPNLDVPGLGEAVVEVGHPLTCTVTLKDYTSGVPTPLANQTVRWTADDPNGMSGLPQLNCYTNGAASLIWTAPCPPNSTAVTPFTCVTDSAGKCSVIYRRLENAISPPGAAGVHALTLATDYQSFTYPSAPKNITVVPALGHPTAMWMGCIGGSLVTPSSFPVRQGNFAATGIIKLHTGNPITCQAWVIDTDPTRALDCTYPSCNNINPDLMDSFSPIGTVTFSPSTGSTGVALGGSLSCSLARQDPNSVPLAPPSVVVPGTTPYAAMCQATFTVTAAAGASGGLTASFNSGPGHVSTSSAPWGNDVRFDFF